jgi:flagellar M-ring protein FliF
LPQGAIRRVSVGLVLDQQVKWEGVGAKAKRTLIPPDEETMKRVHDLVAGAIGIVPSRGDQILVQSLPFETTLQIAPPPDPVAPVKTPPVPLKPSFQLLGRPVDPLMLGGAVASLLLLLAVIGLVVARMRNKGKTVDAGQNAALSGQVKSGAEKELRSGAHDSPPAGTEDSGYPKLSAEERMRLQLQENAEARALQEEEVLNSLKIQQTPTKKSEVLIKHIAEEAKRNPEAVAAIFRSWIAEKER